MSRARRLDPVESFIVGTIGQPGEREFYLQAKFHGGILWLPESEQVLLELQEISEIEINEILPDSSEFEDNSVQLFQLYLSADIANNFISLSRKVVSAGRAPCPFCGLPINMDGHLCPRANGYRR